jgi:HK97 family phage portal protein
MKNIKAITHIPGWAEMLEDAEKVSGAPASYSMVPLIYRATKLRADAISSVPVSLLDGDNEIEWPFDSELESLLWLTEAGLLLSGGGYWLKSAVTDLGNGYGYVDDLIWLNPFSVEVKFNQNTGQSYFVQTAGSVRHGPWTEDEIVYFREWDPLQDTHPGVAPSQVALGDSQLQHYITRFAYHFFEGGAMPVTVLGMENVREGELKRTEGIFQKMMTNIKNAFRIVGVRADAIDIETITPPMTDLAMNELYDQSKKNIASAFGVPTTMLEDPSANRATAESHRISFWAETVRPRGRLIENVMNRQLLNDAGLEIKFNFEEMDVFQVDERERASSLQAYVASGLPLDISLRTLGIDLSPEDWEQLEIEKLERQERQDAMVENFRRGSNNDDDDDDEDEQKFWPQPTRIAVDLSKWRTKAKKALNRKIKLDGQADLTRSQKKWVTSYDRFLKFQSDVIPENVSNRLYTLLTACKSPADVDAVFERFARWTTGEIALEEILRDE